MHLDCYNIPSAYSGFTHLPDNIYIHLWFKISLFKNVSCVNVISDTLKGSCSTTAALLLENMNYTCGTQSEIKTDEIVYDKILT